MLNYHRERFRKLTLRGIALRQRQLIEKIMVNMNFKISRGFEKNVSTVCSCDNEDFTKHRWTKCA